ncbi:MAG: DUF4349 domain-containing protein [Lachnospiraceae bacterium]|nr:DUF4349 domain-containing protein [Lachnospiraceae bacterium]
MKRWMKNTKMVRTTIATMMVGVMLVGCGAASDTTDVSVRNYNDEGFAYHVDDSMADEAYDMEEAPAAGAESKGVTQDEPSEVTSVEESKEQVAKGNQKIIKRYSYDYETEHFDDAYAYLKEQVTSFDGYIASSEIRGSGSSEDYRRLYLTARIPADKSDQFVSGLGQLGTVTNQSESAEDITLQYSDTESRIAALKIEQERLNDLLKQADSLETIIALEERLTDVRYELENYASKKRLYDDLISYSTVDITLEEVKYTVENDNDTFFSRIITGLERSVRDVGQGLLGFIEWFIISIPYFIIWGIIIFVIVRVVRKMRRKSKAKKEKRRQEKEQLQKQQENEKEKEEDA